MPTESPEPLALLSHELRTPLNAVIGYADAMRAGVFGPLNAPYDEHAEIIHRAALHMLALVEELADVSSRQGGPWTGRRECFDAAVLAREIIALLAPRASAGGVALRMEIGAGVADVFAERRAISQILINLLDNALKSTPRGGEITVAVRRDGADLRLVVTDDDRGAERLPRAAGAGLGLRLARALCRRHGGALSLRRTAGRGMNASVRLPVAVEP